MLTPTKSKSNLQRDPVQSTRVFVFLTIDAASVSHTGIGRFSSKGENEMFSSV